MSRASSFVVFVVMCGAAVGAALARDIVGLQLLLAAVAVTAVAAIFVISADARAAVAGRAPRVAWLGRRVMALRWRTIAGSVAGCLSLFVAAEVWERVAYPRGRLGDHLIAAYGADLRDPRPPLLVGAELERSWPADDERYTAVGVVLRYEHDIVALLPDRSGGTRIVREDPVRGYRRFYPYVGDFWGGRYDHRDAVAPSALPVPSDADVAAVERRLADAQRVQGVCFGWDVEIRSGRRKGWFTGPPAEERCQPFLRLVGWIDPDAGRFRRHGSPGTWDLGYESNVPDGRLPPDSVKAINVRKIELMEGKSQDLRRRRSAGREGSGGVPRRQCPCWPPRCRACHRCPRHRRCRRPRRRRSGRRRPGGPTPNAAPNAHGSPFRRPSRGSPPASPSSSWGSPLRQGLRRAWRGN